MLHELILIAMLGFGVVFAIFVAFGVIVVPILLAKANAKRKAEGQRRWERLGHHFGLTLTPEEDTRLRRQLGRFDLFQKRLELGPTFQRKESAADVLRGRVDGRRLAAFDYQYHLDELRYFTLVAAFDISDLDLPEFRVAPRRNVNPLRFEVRLSPPADEFRLGDEEFDSLFTLRGDQRRLVRKAINDRVVALLVDCSDLHLSLECDGDWLLIYVTGMKPHWEVEDIFDTLLKVARRFESGGRQTKAAPDAVS